MTAMARVHPVSWLRERPAMGDTALAVTLAVVSVVFHLTMHEDGASDPSVVGGLLSVGATLPLVWRRRAPAVVLAVVTLFQMAMELINAVGPGWMGVLVAAYTLGAYRSGQVYRRFAVVVTVVVVLFVLVGVLTSDAPWQALLSAPLVIKLPLQLIEPTEESIIHSGGMGRQIRHLGIEVVVEVTFPRRQATGIGSPHALQRNCRRATPSRRTIEVAHQVVMQLHF